MARSNLVIETIAACDLKVGRCRQLFEFMKVCEHFFLILKDTVTPIFIGKTKTLSMYVHELLRQKGYMYMVLNFMKTYPEKNKEQISMNSRQATSLYSYCMCA